ncbi:MAG TPA: undecaprenyl-diphosphate phosphatase [Spirochaetia bacterium]|nr:undecaprenyl-diphosphate phosphatase [Spirochaetia bacterium]
MLTDVQSIIMGLLQGISELFPVSSLGHSVLFPSLFGWHSLEQAQFNPESFILAFLVGLHVAPATALVIFCRQEWAKIVLGFFSSLRKRRAETPEEHLAWLLIVATIPAGIMGLLFEHMFRTLFSKPVAAALFIVANGLVLLVGEQLRNHPVPEAREDFSLTATSQNLNRIRYRDAGLIGASQVFALFAGISRSGITMVGGLLRRLDHEDAARFSFLLATLIILAAGVYKIPDLIGPNGNGVGGQILAGSLVAGIAAYLSVRFLYRYFQNRRLVPFAIYCILFGSVMLVKLIFF